MNIWTEKSFEIAKKQGYLDKISEIYPINQTGGENRIDENSIKEIRKLLNVHKPKELISYLIKLKRFPFDDPYIGFIRHFEEALSRNPKTVKRIFKRLETLGVDGIIEGINRPKSASRKFGHYFSHWIHKQYKVLPEDKFLKINNGIVSLEGGDKKLKDFAKKYLNYDRKKGLDFVIKVKNVYIIGESKFVSSPGGTQDKSVREVKNLVKERKILKVIKVGLVDGVPWVASSTLYRSLHELKPDQYIMSALCFDEFLKFLN
ncbi:MAG: hypothetical protein WC839_02750 [Candidatus Paceibacterota bacterium]